MNSSIVLASVLLATSAVPSPIGLHCVAADDRGNLYVCDPQRGRLLVFRDPYPRIAVGRRSWGNRAPGS